MADFYANENFPLPAVLQLRAFGHNVLTSVEAGTANQGIPDDKVLAFGTQRNRAILTHNRTDFRRLHRLQPDHGGIVICTKDSDFTALARRIDAAVRQHEPLAAKLVSVVRPSF